MRYANIAFFLVAAVLGFTLSAAAISSLPFYMFSVPEKSGFDASIEVLNAAKPGMFTEGGHFYAVMALETVSKWAGIVNFVVAALCAVVSVMPALITIRIAERKLFDRYVDRGWAMMGWMSILGALAVAIHTTHLNALLYIIACWTVICGYIITYQWPKKYHEGHNEHGHDNGGRNNVRHAHH
jgi:hypothetical protein